MASIGIDLGTTNSVLSRIEKGRPVPVSIGGSPIVPSIVLFEGGRIVVGQEAKNLELLHPELTIRSVKRRMGTTEPYSVGNRLLLPEEVSAEILRALKEGAEKALGEAVTEAVITVPAYFDDAQRRATLRAGELAGLHVLRLLNEPTSAALCYEQLGAPAGQTSELVLVYDLGGGTFDVSVLEVFEGVREVRATTGNSRLGGDDFDDALVGVFVNVLKKQSVDPRGDARAMARLRRVAEETKIRLSSDTRVLVREDFLTTADGRSVHLEIEVTRRAFEDLIAPQIEATIVLTRQAIRDAGISPKELARVCLVGGSTRIPHVRARLEEDLGVAIHEEIDPDLAVGLGASLQAAMLRDEPIDRILVDVAAHSLGMRVIGDDDDGYAPPDTFAPILRRNTVLPATRVEEFYTAIDQQAALNVEVFQGERPRVSENTPVGSFLCKLAPRSCRSPVRVAFSYDMNGIVRVSVSQPDVPGEHTAELTVSDASHHGASNASSSSAVERKAEALLASLDGPDHARLEGLLAALRASSGAEREDAEGAVLDFFIDHDADDEG